MSANLLGYSTSFTSPTKVILVRHSRTTYNEQGRYQGSSDESVLTAKGYQAAYQTGIALQQYNFDAIYTSPLTRVKQTTQAITLGLGETTNNLPTIMVDRQLTEIKMLDWQGLFYQEAKDKYPEAYQCWQNTPHLFNFNNNCFPVLELFKQARNFWQETLSKHRSKTILVVAHSGINRALISTAIGLNPKYYHSIQQSNCGISCLEFANHTTQNAKLNYLNVTDHLGENLPKLKAGKTGWRWLLVSNQTSNNCDKSSYLQNFIDKNVTDLILTDNTDESKKLTTTISKKSSKLVHLSINRDHFLDNWQKAIFAKQESNANNNQAGLVTGLIIVSDRLLSEILQKTLNIKSSLDTSNYLSVIHYPHSNRQSILQGILPINHGLVDIKA